MTAEALSPPNPMQSLRERLIQEGSIVPSHENAANSQNSISELVDAIKGKLEKVFSVLLEAGKKFSALEKYIQAFADRFSGFDLISRSGCSYFSLLGFLNLHRILEVLVKHQDKRIGSFLFVRAGFFFAFKENMKNTP
ncbi:hypothetical protein [Diaphorobacter caeni]|uniref:hypothetical protein n=1 Tax=Diaphorobacter caeni TaxID=2784387 RepID=UPI00188E46EF|nr:hypothetical protein [Diaphorobacter caeni]MBF5005333.1 hypothetical protein [Diaphorobacter caeni]